MKFADLKNAGFKRLSLFLEDRFSSSQVRKSLAAIGVFAVLLGIFYVTLDKMTSPHVQPPALEIDIQPQKAATDTAFPPVNVTQADNGDTQDGPYIAPFQTDDPRPRIALVMKGLGIEENITKKSLLELPAGVSIALSPYSNDRAFWLEQAIAARHEVLLGIPMEPENFPDTDPGPLALLDRLDWEQNLHHLNALKADTAQNIGFINLFGNRFLADENQRRNFIDWVRGQNGIFIEQPLDLADTGTAHMAAQIALGYLSAPMQIDGIATTNAIVSRLRRLESEARDKGYAIGIASPYPITIEVLKQWAKDLEGRGIALAPLSAVIDKKNKTAQP